MMVLCMYAYVTICLAGNQSCVKENETCVESVTGIESYGELIKIKYRKSQKMMYHNLPRFIMRDNIKSYLVPNNNFTLTMNLSTAERDGPFCGVAAMLDESPYLLVFNGSFILTAIDGVPITSMSTYDKEEIEHKLRNNVSCAITAKKFSAGSYISWMVNDKELKHDLHHYHKNQTCKFPNVSNYKTLYSISIKQDVSSVPKNLPPCLKKLELLQNIPDNLHLQDNLPAGNEFQNISNQLPNSLVHLCLGGNRIQTIPSNLPDSLIYLDLSGNKIQNIPDRLPNSLTHLYLSRNQIQEIPENLSNSLTHIFLSWNQIQKIPNSLPDSLRYLYLRYNRIEKIPDNLPHSLTNLCLGGNDIVTIPNQLPNSLAHLILFQNKIQHVPDNFPDSLHFLDLFQNPILFQTKEKLVKLQNTTIKCLYYNL